MAPNIKAPHDPYAGYRFWVEWQGIIHAGFRECSGLDSSQEAGTYREGTDPITMRKIPGLISYGNITLSRGITDNNELWTWRESAMQGRVERREISIILCDENTFEEKKRWNVTNCWPTTWTGPTFDATADEVAVETLELAHEGLTLVAP